MFSKDVAEVRQLAASEPSWMRRLKIRHLEVFLTLVETGSQSATAAQLNITQPALSKWLRELEEDIGAPLFERGRRLTPTTYGEIVLHYAHRVLGDTTRMGDELKTFQAGQSGRVRVGLLRSAAATLIPKVITGYRQIAPDVRISLFEDTLDNLLPRLERRELDCILCRLYGKAPIACAKATASCSMSATGCSVGSARSWLPPGSVASAELPSMTASWSARAAASTARLLMSLSASSLVGAAALADAATAGPASASMASDGAAPTSSACITSAACAGR